MVPRFRLPLLINETFHQNETTPPKKACAFIDFFNDKPYPDKIKLFFVVGLFLSRGVPKFAQDKKKPLRKEANSGAGVEVNKKGYRRLQVNFLKKVRLIVNHPPRSSKQGLPMMPFSSRCKPHYFV
jgi:hypothetical protein